VQLHRKMKIQYYIQNFTMFATQIQVSTQQAHHPLIRSSFATALFLL
jgi:pterin-4a-carbinolamine dehydratase